jgi:hypothetical protein
MDQPATTFNTGEAITFQLSIANQHDTPATLTAASSCQATTFEVWSITEQRLWGSADGIACVMAVQPRVYAPREEVVYETTWNQRDGNGAQLPAGTYSMRAHAGQYATDAQGKLTHCSAKLDKTATFRIM